MNDLISRKEAYKVLMDYYHIRTEIQKIGLREALDRVPSAEPDRVTPCNIVLDEKGWLKYCPICGARMEKGEDDE